MVHQAVPIRHAVPANERHRRLCLGLVSVFLIAAVSFATIRKNETLLHESLHNSTADRRQLSTNTVRHDHSTTSTTTRNTSRRLWLDFSTLMRTMNVGKSVLRAKQKEAEKTEAEYTFLVAKDEGNEDFLIVGAKDHIGGNDDGDDDDDHDDQSDGAASQSDNTAKPGGMLTDLFTARKKKSSKSEKSRSGYDIYNWGYHRRKSSDSYDDYEWGYFDNSKSSYGGKGKGWGRYYTSKSSKDTKSTTKKTTKSTKSTKASAPVHQPTPPPPPPPPPTPRPPTRRPSRPTPRPSRRPTPRPPTPRPTRRPTPPAPTPNPQIERQRVRYVRNKRKWNEADVPDYEMVTTNCGGDGRCDAKWRAPKKVVVKNSQIVSITYALTGGQVEEDFQASAFTVDEMFVRIGVAVGRNAADYVRARYNRDLGYPWETEIIDDDGEGAKGRGFNENLRASDAEMAVDAKYTITEFKENGGPPLEPTREPSSMPTKIPTDTSSPTNVPTPQQPEPTAVPTAPPTTGTPTNIPTDADEPSSSPTTPLPSAPPTPQQPEPSSSPTTPLPSAPPTPPPTSSPVDEPTTPLPSASPTPEPSEEPSMKPSAGPTALEQTDSPSAVPSVMPSMAPSATPSQEPTEGDVEPTPAPTTTFSPTLSLSLSTSMSFFSIPSYSVSLSTNATEDARRRNRRRTQTKRRRRLQSTRSVKEEDKADGAPEEDLTLTDEEIQLEIGGMQYQR